MRAALVLLVAACSSHPNGTTPDAPIPETRGDAWVDPQLGTDDLAHGGAPGADAYRTITFALARATATIHLDDGTYDHASGETFPLHVIGDQVLAGGAALGAHVVGNGDNATIELGGHANQVVAVDVSAAGGTSSSSTCVAITTNGAHVVSNSNLHGCFAAVDFGGHGGATIDHVTTGDVSAPTAGNCLNQVGDDVHVAHFSCAASNDWIFVCGANFTGCDTPVMGRVAACTDDLSRFTDACP
jgi:hypothetical protein